MKAGFIRRCNDCGELLHGLTLKNPQVTCQCGVVTSLKSKALPTCETEETGEVPITISPLVS